MAGPILYIAEVDYPAEHLVPHGKWNDWYAHRHAPDLLRFGSRSVASYRPVIGGLAVLNVYEIPDAAMLKTPKYAAVSAQDPYAAATRDLSAGKKRAQTLYLERLLMPADGQTIDADWISVLRFGLPESEDAALIDWLGKNGQKILGSAKRIRYGTRIEQKVGAGSFRPRCVIFAEFAARPAASAELLPSLQQKFGAQVTEAEPFVGSRAYPWPDVPA